MLPLMSNLTLTAAWRRSKPARILPAALLLVALLLAPTSPSKAAPASLTYTGQLLTSLSPPTAANGFYDFQFQLYNAASGGTQAGLTVSLSSVPVVNGIYYAQLNFGSVFGGPTYWLQINYRVHPASGSPPYTAPTFRPIAPNSAFADFATLAGNTLALQGRSVSVTAPTAGQVLTYSGTLWTPTALPAATAYAAGPGLNLAGTIFSIPTGGVTGSMLAVPLSLNASSSAPLLAVGNGSSGGAGISGTNTVTGDYGLLGGTEPITGASAPVGVYGSDTAPNGGFGVFGNSTHSAGVVGNSTSSVGLFGISSSSGIDEKGSGDGVYAVSGSGSGLFATSTSGDGVDGYSSSNTGVYGQSASSTGVSGYSNSSYGVYGSTAMGHAAGFFYTPSGLNGVIGESDAANGDGVQGMADNGSGVYGTSANGYGVYGNSASYTAGNFVSNSGYGIAGVSTSNVGVYGQSSSGYAGYFQGKVTINGGLSVTGAITAGTKDFKIDHPLDPSGKYLYHASVESSEMKDIYDGVVILGSDGSAWVLLPDWFQALNRDFRYQLTGIGGFAPVYVAQKVTENRFQIAGGKPGMEVSWQVTGVRQDAFANAHPLQVEEEKPANEQGLYLHPVENGQPESLGIGYAQRQAHAARGPRQP